MKHALFSDRNQGNLSDTSEEMKLCEHELLINTDRTQDMKWRSNTLEAAGMTEAAVQAIFSSGHTKKGTLAETRLEG